MLEEFAPLKADCRPSPPLSMLHLQLVATGSYLLPCGSEQKFQGERLLTPLLTALLE